MSGPIKVDVISRLNRNLALLQAGSTVTIDITTPAGKRGKFRSIFIGYLPKQYVLIQFPDATKLGNFGQFITQGTNITVRGLIEGHEGAVVAFVSPILQTIQMPSRMMVLDFPKEVSLQHLRNSIRIDTDISAKIKIGGDYWQANIVDMSIKGGQIYVTNGDKLLLNKEQAIELVIENFKGASNIKIPATICNSKSVVDGLSIGVQFSDLEKHKPSILNLVQHAVIGGE